VVHSLLAALGVDLLPWSFQPLPVSCSPPLPVSCSPPLPVSCSPAAIFGPGLNFCRLVKAVIVRNRTLTLIKREDDTKSWSNLLVYFSHNDMPTKGVGVTYL
jgi:hypothetical protein